jgi:hypothetical protein
VLRSVSASLWREGARAAILYAALTLVLAYPLSLDPDGRVLTLEADTDLMLWALAWDVHAFTSAPLSIFDANIFYPQRRTLAYSENFIGSALVAAPILWLTGNVVLAMNVVVLLSCVLCGVGAYILCRRVGIAPPAALVGGIIFAFAPPRFFRLAQLHLTTIQWVPFTLASLHAYLDSGVRRHLWWACAFFALQVLTTGHGAVFAAIAVATLLIWRAALGEPLVLRKRLRDLNVPGVAFLGAAAAVLTPYIAVQEEMGLRRSLRDGYFFAPNLASFFASPTYVHGFLRSWLDAPILRNPNAFLFPGCTTLALVVACVWPRMRGSSTRGRTPQRDRRIRRIATAVEIALIAALGAALASALLGGVRLRAGGAVLLSLREPWRPLLLCVVLAIVRLALHPRVPIAPIPRARQLTSQFREWAARHRRSAVAVYGVLALITLWLALGPAYGLYAIVYSWPGFSFIRVPSRFTLLTLLALSVLAAAGLERLTARFGPRGSAAAAAFAAALLTIEYAAIPLNSYEYRVDIPSIDRWLATQPAPFVVAELPLPDPRRVGTWERRHALYMLHSTAHWQKTIHGYSGMRPRLHSDLYNEMTTFPDADSLIGLTEVGVTRVVVHTDWYPSGEWDAAKARFDEYGAWLTLEHTEGAGRVYALSRPPEEQLLRHRFDDYAAALARGDVEAVASFYVEGAAIVAPNAPARFDAVEVRIDGAEGEIRGPVRSQAMAVGIESRFVQKWRRMNGRWRLSEQVIAAEVSHD